MSWFRETGLSWKFLFSFSYSESVCGPTRVGEQEEERAARPGCIKKLTFTDETWSPQRAWRLGGPSGAGADGLVSSFVAPEDFAMRWVYSREGPRRGRGEGKAARTGGAIKPATEWGIEPSEGLWKRQGTCLRVTPQVAGEPCTDPPTPAGHRLRAVQQSALRPPLCPDRPRGSPSAKQSLFLIWFCFGGKFNTWRSLLCSSAGRQSPGMWHSLLLLEGAACSKDGWNRLCSLAGAVLTKHRRSGGFKHRSLFGQVSGD